MTSLSILFEDSHLLVVDKPALLHSVSQEYEDDSAARRLTERFPDQYLVAEREGDGGFINRLDFETSGLLVAARSREVWIALRDQFSRHEIKKRYLAHVEGVPQTPCVVEGYIGNRHRGSKKVTFQRDEKARFLFTRSEIHEIVWSGTAALDSFIAVETTTGARHQVRAHCAAIGHPLVGDLLYGSTAVESPEAPPFILHAHRLTLRHPIEKRIVTFEAPPPPYLCKP